VDSCEIKVAVALQGVTRWGRISSRRRGRRFLRYGQSVTVLFFNPLRPRLSRRRCAPAPVSATSPFRRATHAKGEAGHGPSGRSPREMRGSRFMELLRRCCAPYELERGIPPSDPQHPTASFPFVRSTKRGEVSQRGVCVLRKPELRRWGFKIKQRGKQKGGGPQGPPLLLSS
jgi:hypothetical protein